MAGGPTGEPGGLLQGTGALSPAAPHQDNGPTKFEPADRPRSSNVLGPANPSETGSRPSLTNTVRSTGSDFRSLLALAQADRPSSGNSLLERRRRTPLSSLKVINPNPGLDKPSKLPDSLAQSIEKDFEIRDTLGQGSTSIVQRAVRRSDGQHVALKKLCISDPDLIPVAEQEFQLLKQMTHPNIIAVYDFWTFADEGRAVMSMELFEGHTLDVVVGEHKRRPRDEMQPILRESCVQDLGGKLVRAVDFLHQHRVVHRDVKPQNLMVSPDLADLKMVDFNTARSLRSGAALTPTGTQLYAAPETLRGEPPSEAGDVWSVGVCVYYMLSGALPQKRDRLAACGAVTRREIQQASRHSVKFTAHVWDHVSPCAKDWLKKALALRAADRPAPMILLNDRWLNEEDSSARRLRPTRSDGPEGGASAQERSKELGIAKCRTDETEYSQVRRSATINSQCSFGTCDELTARTERTEPSARAHDPISGSMLALGLKIAGKKEALPGSSPPETASASSGQPRMGRRGSTEARHSAILAAIRAEGKPPDMTWLKDLELSATVYYTRLSEGSSDERPSTERVRVLLVDNANTRVKIRVEDGTTKWVQPGQLSTTPAPKAKE